MSKPELAAMLEAAIHARSALFDARHELAFRLLNGFLEGWPTLAIDLYGRTIVLHNYADPPEAGTADVQAAQAWLCERLPWIDSVVVKTRHAATSEEANGVVVFGEAPARKVREHGVWYALDILLNRDASLYLDTRHLREWAVDSLSGKSVLNTFAYTGSLGVAARAGGATRVVHLDLNRRFLNLAKTSYTLNGFPIHKADFQTGDFWTEINRLKRADERFDCVFVDPPIFATTKHGTVDLANNSGRLINKVRPLVNDGGYIVAINNAVFVSGKAYLETLAALCADGYLAIEALLPVPLDFTGYPETLVSQPITDPAPFNHSTKIALLRVRRKA